MIDAHVHFWIYSPATHPWIGETMSALKRDFLPEHLEPLLVASGFDGCIAVQAAQTIDETRWLLDLADRHEFIRGVIGWVDLRSTHVERDLEELVKRPKLRGIRHGVQDEPDDRFVLRRDFQRGIATLARFGLVYDLLVYPRQLPAAIELVERFPEQPFVLDHLGKPEIRARRVEPWATHLRALARHGNVACKVSGLVTEADGQRWTREEIAPYVEVAAEAFGPERLLVGSDWPVCTLAGDFASVTNLVERCLTPYAENAHGSVLERNVERVYRMRA